MDLGFAEFPQKGEKFNKCYVCLIFRNYCPERESGKILVLNKWVAVWLFLLYNTYWSEARHISPDKRGIHMLLFLPVFLRENICCWYMYSLEAPG